MADWNLPSLASLYTDFLTYLKDRDLDVAKMFSSAPTNPVEGMMRYVRASNKFQEYLSAVWTDKNISLAGGGTGAATAADARTNLGLGSMAIQVASAVAITGGTMSGVAVSGGTLTGTAIAATSTIADSVLGSGSPSSTTFLRGDRTWAVAADDLSTKLAVEVYT